MSGYTDIYFKRINKYGTDFQSRTQNQREKVFEQRLNRSIYRIDFEYEGELHPATFERYKQDETQTLHYLLTRTDLKIPNGTIIEVPNTFQEPTKLERWMIYRLEKIYTSGYNRYICLKMSHYISWKDREGNQQGTWAYFFGQENTALKEEIKNIHSNTVVYTENNKLNYFICPVNEYINKDDYFTLGEGNLKQAFVVTGYDRVSTEGVEYVSVDPRFIRDETAAPIQPENDTSNDYYWLGGVKNG